MVVRLHFSLFVFSRVVQHLASQSCNLARLKPSSALCVTTRLVFLPLSTAITRNRPAARAEIENKRLNAERRKLSGKILRSSRKLRVCSRPFLFYSYCVSPPSVNIKSHGDVWNAFADRLTSRRDCERLFPTARKSAVFFYTLDIYLLARIAFEMFASLSLPKAREHTFVPF